MTMCRMLRSLDTARFMTTSCLLVLGTCKGQVAILVFRDASLSEHGTALREPQIVPGLASFLIVL